jgi:hypothetical protein
METPNFGHHEAYKVNDIQADMEPPQYRPNLGHHDSRQFAYVGIVNCPNLAKLGSNLRKILWY